MRSQFGKPPGAMVIFGPGLPHSAVSGSITLQQLGSILMSVVRIAREAI